MCATQSEPNAGRQTLGQSRRRRGRRVFANARTIAGGSDPVRVKVIVNFNACVSVNVSLSLSVNVNFILSVNACASGSALRVACQRAAPTLCRHSA